MENERSDKQHKDWKGYTVLVAVDFSPFSAHALRKAKSIMGQKPNRILVLHVIDHNFIEKCINNQIGTKEVASFEHKTKGHARNFSFQKIHHKKRALSPACRLLLHSVKNFDMHTALFLRSAPLQFINSFLKQIVTQIYRNFSINYGST